MRPLLPQLNNSLAPGPIQGEWVISSNSIFTIIAQALKYDQAVRTNINSIPSPWARALMFQSVILTNQYPNRQELIHEYFGFLAVLAFSLVKNLPIQARLVKLNGLAKASPFADSLVGLLPSSNDSILISSTNDNPWENIYTFTLNGHPLGFSSPATMVVPSISLSPQLTKYIPWLQENTIQGPGDRGKTFFRYGDPKQNLGDLEKAAFAGWLSNIKESILTINSPNQNLSNSLGMIIQDYIISLGVAAAPNVLTSLQIFGVALNPKPLGALAQVIDPGSIKGISNVQVLPGIKKHEKQLYFVDKDIVPQVLNHPIHNICVEGATTLQAFQNVPNVKNQSATYWDQNNFFLPRLRWYSGKGMLPGTWLEEIQSDFNNKTFIPPLNPEINNFFNSEDLRIRLKMVPIMTSDGEGVRVSFELKISGINNSPVRLSLCKDYTIKSEDELKGSLPYISLWPNLPTESKWSTFYLAVQENKQESRVPFAFTVETPTVILEDSVLDGISGTIYRVWQTNENPNVLCLLDKRGGDYIGIIPILTPQINSGSSSKWTIGVDFGTSFTNLHVSKAGSKERLELLPLTLNITLSPENTDTNRDFFIPGVFTAPPDGFNPPMSTLLTIRGNTAVTTPKFITESRIYVPYLDEPSFKDYVISGIKRNKPKYLDPFLTALINLVSAHAANNNVGEIIWRASYPTAFSETQIGEYKNAWIRAIEAAKKVSKLSHKMGTDGTNLVPSADAFKTESIAFAQYFANEFRQQIVDTTCVDVGGGTSDISIWKKMKLIHQLSVPIAGRDIFHNILRENIERIGELFGLSGEKSKELQIDLKNSGDNFDAYLDSYLRLKGSLVLEQLRIGNSSIIKEFRSLLVLSYAGLYYYIGLVLRYLNQSEATPVYLGGNGSRFINWCVPDGQYSESSEVNRLLAYVLNKAGGFSTEIRRDTVLSKNPKQEAAGGLIVDDTSLIGISESTPEAFAGIGMKFDTDIGIISFDPQDLLILPKTCETIKSISIDDFTEIHTFIDVFNEAIRECNIRGINTCPIGTKPGNISPKNLNFDLKNEVITLLNFNQTKEGLSRQDYQPDPGFIVSHKGLLRVLAKKWGKS